MGCGVSLMGITPVAHQAGQRLVALVEQRLIIGRLLVVDELVGLLQLLELFPDIASSTPPKVFLRNFMADS